MNLVDLNEYRFRQPVTENIPVHHRWYRYKGVLYLVEVPPELTDDYCKGVMVTPIGIVKEKNVMVKCPGELLTPGSVFRVEATDLQRVADLTLIYDITDPAKYIYYQIYLATLADNLEYISEWEELAFSYLPSVNVDNKKI